MVEKRHREKATPAAIEEDNTVTSERPALVLPRVPERFSPEHSSRQPRCAYIPFSFGPRFCIGASLALTEGVMVLAHVAQHYRLRLAPGQSVEPRGLLSLHPRNGLFMHRVRSSRQTRRSSTTDS